jgi:hypothetical protein
MPPEEELARLSGDVEPEYATPLRHHPAPFFVRGAVIAERSSAQVLTGVVEVLRVVLEQQQRGDWPDNAEWRSLLPEWFVAQTAPEMPIETDPPRRPRWWQLVRSPQVHEQAGPWSLGNWLYWFRPENRTWFWWGAYLVSTTEISLLLAADDWPVLVGALEWAFACAGAAEIRLEEAPSRPPF